MNTGKSIKKNRLLLSVTIAVTAMIVPLFLSGILVRLTTEQQMLMTWGFILLVLMFRRLLQRFSVFFGVFLSLCTLFFLGRYLVFRTTSTLIYTSPVEFTLLILLFVAELYGMMIQLLGMIVNVLPLYRPALAVSLTDPNLPVVDVLIPTYNEPEQMVAVTASACTLLNYPKNKLNIYILDNGGTIEKRNDPDPGKAERALMHHETLKVLAEYLEVNYLTREKMSLQKPATLMLHYIKPLRGKNIPKEI